MSTNVIPFETSAPALPARGLTLYELEDRLACLAETLDAVSEEQAADLLADIADTDEAAVQKRDSYGRFLAHLDAQVAFATAEICRIRERKAAFERIIGQVEGALIRVLKKRGKDARGKWRKLEGHSYTFGLRNLAAKPAIDDETAIPIAYKVSTVALPAELWEQTLDAVGLEFAGKLQDASRRRDEITIAPLAKSLKGGDAVPGAHLVTDGVSLKRVDGRLLSAGDE